MTQHIVSHDLQRMILLLDAADEALTAAADLEKRNEAGKPLRSITAQERAKATRRFVAKMASKYNVSVD